MPVERIAPDSIRLERTARCAGDTVWRYLTEAELRRSWFMGGTDATPGGEFDLLVDHDNLSDEPTCPTRRAMPRSKARPGTSRCVRFEPPRLLETTFQGGKNGTVTYELIAEGERTRLVLTHSGIVSAVPARRISAAAGIRT